MASVSQPIEQHPRVAFLFTSSRAAILSGVREGREADTALRGLNHLRGAEMINLSETAHPFLLTPRLLRYDFVLASDALPLGFLVSLLARLLHQKTRWVYMAITSSTLMRRHARHPLRLFVLKRFWTSYFRIICLSKEQLEDFARLGISRERLVFIPFGIDAKFFAATEQGSGEDFVLSVGRDAGRDYETLFRAAALSGHQFVVVAAHRNIPPEMSVPANVIVKYNLSIAEIRDLYARARMVVVASKAEHVPGGSDCSGQTVVLDALAAGKPVIATSRAWITDYLTPSEDLIVVAPDEPGALATAIERIWQNPAEGARFARAGQAKVRARYTTKAFAQALEKLFAA